MLPGDRLLCIFLEDLQPGRTFTGWPLHITIIPWFRTELTTADLVHELRDALAGITPFQITVAGEAGFGFKGRKLVNLISQPSPLDNIERQSRLFLRGRQAWMVDETTEQRRPFHPHITVQKSGRAQEGERFKCDAIYVIEQKGGQKEVAGKIEL